MERVENHLPERSIRAAVYRVLDYLLSKNVLKVTSIEGMDAHFNSLESIFYDYQLEERMKFVKWAEYWKALNHKNHSTPFTNPEQCLAETCISIKSTIQELSRT